MGSRFRLNGIYLGLLGNYGATLPSTCTFSFPPHSRLDFDYLKYFYGILSKVFGSPKMIQRPYTLTELPNNLITPRASVLTADVYTLVGSRKRKRPELVVALDNESVNLYDVC